MNCLEGKVALVTGGTMGVGLATAYKMAAVGARVAITARNEERGRAVVQEISAAGGEVTFFCHDVTEAESWSEVLGGVREIYGGLHVLVNNAGAHLAKPFMATSLEDFDQLFNINLRGVFVGTQLAVPLIRETLAEQEHGAVINVSSGAALKSAADESIYSATKGALQILSRALAREFGAKSYRIRVNTVNPGIIETPMFERSIDEAVKKGLFETADQARSTLVTEYPLGRFALPDDVARAITFLASDEASYVTGATLTVDGGETC